MIYPPFPPPSLSAAEHEEARNLEHALVVLDRAPVDERGRSIRPHEPRRVYRVMAVCSRRERERCFRVEPVASRAPSVWMPFGSIRMAHGPFLWCACGTVLEGLCTGRTVQCERCGAVHKVP